MKSKQFILVLVSFFFFNSCKNQEALDLLNDYNRIVNVNKNNNADITVVKETDEYLELLILFKDTSVITESHQVAVITYFINNQKNIKNKKTFSIIYGLDFEPEYRNVLNYTKKGFKNTAEKTYEDPVFNEIISYVVFNFRKYDFIDYENSYEFINKKYKESLSKDFFVLLNDFSKLHDKVEFSEQEKRVIVTIKGLFDFFNVDDEPETIRLRNQINDIWKICMGTELVYDAENKEVIEKPIN